MGAATMMAHPWFSRIDWHVHAHSAGHLPGAASQSLQALAAAGGTLGLHGQHGVPQPKMAPGGNLLGSGGNGRTASGGSKTSLGGAEGYATRSVHSMGMESERSAASTSLADLSASGGDGSETTTHLDNLVGLNEQRGLLCSEGEQWSG